MARLMSHVILMKLAELSFNFIMGKLSHYALMLSTLRDAG
jgi:hypothetical protein